MTRGHGPRGKGSVAPWQFNDVHTAPSWRTWECDENPKGDDWVGGREGREEEGNEPWWDENGASPSGVLSGWMRKRKRTSNTLARGYLAFVLSRSRSFRKSCPFYA